MIDYRNYLSKEELLKVISQEDIFRFYLGSNFVLNKSISSPIRKDSIPSFSLFYSTKGDLLYKDFSHQESGDCIKFIQRLFSIDYHSALKKIQHDIIDKNNFSTNYTKVDNNNSERLYTPKYKRQTEITIQPKPFRKKDYEWFKSQGISDFTLDKFNVQCADKVYINSKLSLIGLVNNPIYFYTQNSRYRIYIPLNPKGRRWYGNMLSQDLQGLEYIPDNSNSLILIQKSYKDLMAISEQLGIYGVCKPGEGYKWLQEDILKLQSKSSKLITNFDYDFCGVHNANDLKKKYKIPYIFMSNSRTEKRLDYTDTYKLYGKEYADMRIIKLIEKINSEYIKE